MTAVRCTTAHGGDFNVSDVLVTFYRYVVHFIMKYMYSTIIYSDCLH